MVPTRKYFRPVIVKISEHWKISEQLGGRYQSGYSGVIVEDIRAVFVEDIRVACWLYAVV